MFRLRVSDFLPTWVAASAAAASAAVITFPHALGAPDKGLQSFEVYVGVPLVEEATISRSQSPLPTRPSAPPPPSEKKCPLLYICTYRCTHARGVGGVPGSQLGCSSKGQLTRL